MTIQVICWIIIVGVGITTYVVLVNKATQNMRYQYGLEGIGPALLSFIIAVCVSAALYGIFLYLKWIN